ncbi:hypothetical protein IAR55_002318 [Kwoniella newhampshirensis]|uniref:RGS domain-containing protein n=1 Tax=Kwoniella newhampshirensis TaxID=1651941 RepID=A0AAW0Z141_9TREE
MTAPSGARPTSFSTPSLALLAPSTTQPPLEELKLSHILNGETCPPISFPEFAAFVANRDFTTENLLFVVWFRNYRVRFDALKAEIKAQIPVPSTRLGDRYNPFGYLDEALAKIKDGNEVEEQEAEGTFAGPFRRSSVAAWLSDSEPVGTTHRFRPCRGLDGPCGCGGHTNLGHQHHDRSRLKLFSRSSSSRIKTCSTDSASPSSVRPIIRPSLYPPLPPPGTEIIAPALQPMREEAQRAFATFLRKGGSRELGISDELREFAKVGLVRSTAPEIFLPIYEEIYSTVETQSLPRFLEAAKTNINRPKVLFWYFVGFVDFMIGLIIYLLLTLLLPRHSIGLRAYRLLSTIFVCFGIMQAYSAYRGFCSQVWGRSHRQVRPWEMDDLDDEETLVEGNGPEAEVEAKCGVGGVPDGCELVQMTDADLILPMEVQPLSDFGGTTGLGTDADDVKLVSPSSSNLDSSFPTVPVLETDMTDVQRRQMDLRRTTVKVPRAKEAFPIGEHEGPRSPKLRISQFDTRQQRDISPFVVDGDQTTVTRPLSVSATSQTHSKPPTVVDVAQRTGKDLSTLLNRLRRSNRKTSGGMVDPISRRGSEASQMQREKKIKVFGPERLVEDPRIKKVYQDIKRDILIVGSLTAFIWIVLCLAVPCAGLAS